MLPRKTAVNGVVVAALLVGLCACSKADPASTSSASDTTTATARPWAAVQPVVTMANQLSAAAAGKLKPTTTANTYPRWVAKADVDPRYTHGIQGDRMVMLAPGVYAEAPPDGVLGTAADYTSYRGNCTTIQRYIRQ